MNEYYYEVWITKRNYESENESSDYYSHFYKSYVVKALDASSAITTANNLHCNAYGSPCSIRNLRKV